MAIAWLVVRGHWDVADGEQFVQSLLLAGFEAACELYWLLKLGGLE